MSEALKQTEQSTQTGKLPEDSTFKAEIAKLKEELSDRYKSLDLLRQELESAQKEHSEAEKSTEESISSKDVGLKSEIVRLTQELTKRNDEFNELKKELEVVRIQKEKLEAENKEKVLMKSTVDNMKEFELQAAQKKVAELEASVSVMF